MLTTWPRRLWGSRRCPICGAANYACGGPTHMVPVDLRMEQAMAKAGKLQPVDVPDGRGGTMRVRLGAEKAKRYQPKSRRAASKPDAETKARQPQKTGDVETK